MGVTGFGAGRRRTVAVAVPVLGPIVLVAVLLTSCSAESESVATSSGDATTATLTAELRTSSRDAALGRTQVWIHNHGDDALEPVSIVLDDARLPAPVPAERLRAIPPGSERGYPIPLPSDPPCDPDGSGTDGHGVVDVSTARGPVHVEFSDPLEVVGTRVDEQCLTRAVAKVADLHWADRLAPASGSDAMAAIVLVAEPTDATGHRLIVERISGTPVLTPPGRPHWEPNLAIDAGSGVRRVRLPVAPARCDPHAFAESGGATAFRLHVRFDGRPASLVLRMDPPGARAVLDAALAECGLQ